MGLGWAPPLGGPGLAEDTSSPSLHREDSLSLGDPSPRPSPRRTDRPHGGHSMTSRASSSVSRRVSVVPQQSLRGTCVRSEPGSTLGCPGNHTALYLKPHARAFEAPICNNPILGAPTCASATMQVNEVWSLTQRSVTAVTMSPRGLPVPLHTPPCVIKGCGGQSCSHARQDQGPIGSHSDGLRGGQCPGFWTWVLVASSVSGNSLPMYFEHMWCFDQE